MMYLYTLQLLASDVYDDMFSAINCHNQIRCNNLKLEKNLVTHSLDQSVNLSMFGVAVVDTVKVAT